MATINLRDYYPFYQHDMFIEVSDEVAGQLSAWKRSEAASFNQHRQLRSSLAEWQRMLLCYWTYYRK